MKALLYTSDPYEPSGVIGLFETEEQKQAIISGYRAEMIRTRKKDYTTEDSSGFYNWLPLEQRLKKFEEEVESDIANWEEVEIPVGVYGPYS